MTEVAEEEGGRLLEKRCGREPRFREFLVSAYMALRSFYGQYRRVSSLLPSLHCLRYQFKTLSKLRRTLLRSTSRTYIRSSLNLAYLALPHLPMRRSHPHFLWL